MKFTEYGQTFRYVPESEQKDVCDFCGRVRSCAWFENEKLGPRCRVGFDICRACIRFKKSKGELIE